MRRPSRSFSCCFFSLVILCCACSQLPFLSGVHGDANSTNSCDSSSFTPCADLGNNSYPFGGSAGCAASRCYVLSNCTPSSTQAFWDSFSDAALGVVGSPAVTVATPDYEAFSLSGSYSVTFQLSWNKSLVGQGPCPPLFSSSNLALYNIPSSINLTRFPDSSALSFTSHNVILLFNCARNASDFVVESDVVVESDDCTYYKALCGSQETILPCIQVTPNMEQVLMLQHVLDTLACPHFMFGMPSYNQFGGYTMFTPAVFELFWTDTQCLKCQGKGGKCNYETFLPKFSHCECHNGTRIDVNTHEACSSEDCEDGLYMCNMGLRVGVTVALLIVGVLGIYVLIRIGCPRFSKVTIPVVISILKKILRKLQSVSYGHKRSLDLLDLDGLTERPAEYSYGSLASATKSFSGLVGEGGFGTVYKGTLTTQASKTHNGGVSEQQQIAVKVLDAKSKHSKKQFLNEVVTIGKIHHVNVVRLLGFCMQEDHEMLVYEFVVNGSLDKWLFNKKGRLEEHVLDWGQRFAIAVGVARGLSYLHEECRHRTVHCDIKPQNILLDVDMHPKIADFGLARLMKRDESKVVTFAKGTPGYMAPEFWRGGESQLSTKFDVYSYGMVLLELVSGHRNFDAVAMANGSSFPARAFKAAMEGDLESIIDPRLDIMSDMDDEGKQVQWQQVKTAVLIALWCIQDHPAGRPHMSEVVKYLEGGAAISDCPPQPTISISCASYPHQQELYVESSHNESECTPLSVGR